MLGLIRSAAAAAGQRTAQLAGRAGQLAGDVAVVFGESYHRSIEHVEDSRREGIKKSRADRLGITPDWYDELAADHGEEELIEAALEKSQDGQGGDRSDSFLDRWRGLTESPYEPVAAWGGWRERPSALSYEMLDATSRRIGPFTAFLQTRLNQGSEYSETQKDKHGTGFVVRKREEQALAEKQAQGETPEQPGEAGKPKPKSKSWSDDPRAVELAKAVGNCGFLPKSDPEAGETRDGFRTFLRKAIRDTLIYDQLCIEMRRDRKGKILEWRVLDAKTIRRCSKQVTAYNAFGEKIVYAQIIDGTVLAEFSANDLTFNIRNPRSDIKCYGYGLSEIEMMVSVVTALMNGFEHNARYFSQGTTAKGLLSIHGIVPRAHLRAFRKRWIAMVTGASNAWRVPVLNVPDEKSSVKWVDLQKTNLDMEWSKFMDWLLKVMCAVLQISPEEIGFQYGNTGQASAMGDGGGQKDKVAQSKDKGLKPLIKFLEATINEEIIWKIDPTYEIAFLGLDNESEQSEVELLVKEVGSYMTVDEAREARNLGPDPNGLGTLILNPQYVQAYNQQKMQQSQQPPPQQAGGFDGVGGFGGMFGDEDQGGSGQEDQGQPPGASQPPAGAPVQKSRVPLTGWASVRRLSNRGVSSYTIEL